MKGIPKYAQPWALPATAVQAYPPVTSEGTPGMAPANPADPKIVIPVSKPAPAGREVRTEGMAHDTHAATHANPLPAELGAPAFVDGWRMRALIVAGIFAVVAAVLAFLDQSIDHVLRAWVLGLMLTFGLDGGRTGAADGAVLFGRQVGPAAASSAGGDEPDTAAGFCLLGGDCVLHEEALSVGCELTDTAAALKAGCDQRDSSALHRIQAADAEPRRRLL